MVANCAGLWDTWKRLSYQSRMADASAELGNTLQDGKGTQRSEATYLGFVNLSENLENFTAWAGTSHFYGKAARRCLNMPTNLVGWDLREPPGAKAVNQVDEDWDLVHFCTCRLCMGEAQQRNNGTCLPTLWGEDSSKEQWCLPAVSPSLTLKPEYSVSPHMSLVPFE